MSTPSQKFQRDLRQRNRLYFDALHDNLTLLFMERTPSAELTRVYSRDMFEKNAKASFQQVVHYLLRAVEPDVIKTKVPTWPILDVKSESKFCSEVLKYVAELNGKLGEQFVPVMTASHFVNPKGVRFARFMFRLSLLTMREVIGDSMVLLPVDGSYDDTIVGVEKEINKECLVMENDLRRKLAAHKAEADGIMQEFEELNISIPKLQEQLKTLLKNVKSPEVTTVEVYEAKISQLMKTAELYAKATESVDYILSEDSQVVFDANDFNIPKKVAHIIGDTSKGLNLLKLLEAYNTFIKLQLLETDGESLESITAETEEVRGLNVVLRSLNAELDQLSEWYDVLMTDCNKIG